MQFEKSTFSIYKKILKIPTLCLYLLTIIFLGIAFSTFLSMYNYDRNVNQNVKKCMKNYYKNIYNSSTDKIDNNSSKINDYFDFGTLVNISISDQCFFAKSIEFDAQSQWKESIVQLSITNQLFDRFNRSQKYFQKHNIHQSLLQLPKPQIVQPVFSFFFNRQNSQKQLIIQYLAQTMMQVQSQKEKQQNNIVINTSNMKHHPIYNELILNVFPQSNYKTFKEFQVERYIKEKDLLIFEKIILAYIYLVQLVSVSMVVGLEIRLFQIFIFNAISFVKRCQPQSRPNWIYQQMNIILKKYQTNKKSAIQIAFCFLVAFFFMYILLMESMLLLSLVLAIWPSVVIYAPNYLAQMLLLIVPIQLFHLFCVRTRVSLRFYPLISLIINFINMTYIRFSGFNEYSIELFLNINLSIQLAVMTIFLLIQKKLQNQQTLQSYQYIPTPQKPRMMFYPGYDISWENGTPPLWTFFNFYWYDYSYFNDIEKSYLQSDYQLLYGCMIGMRQRQLLPEQLEDQEQVQLIEEVGSDEISTNELDNSSEKRILIE